MHAWSRFKHVSSYCSAGYNAEDPDSTLELISKPIPRPPAPGYVLVHVTLRPLNPADLLTIRIPEIAEANGYPETPGTEGFGIVEEKLETWEPRDALLYMYCSRDRSEGVTSVAPGQRVVLGLDSGNGSWQEYVSLTEELIIPIPDSISDESAAQFVINPWSVIRMLKEQDVPKGEYLIQTAAGSVLGSSDTMPKTQSDLMNAGIGLEADSTATGSWVHARTCHSPPTQFYKPPRHLET
ncbi:unnamed protein product [Calypogeia fissa]